MACCRCPRETTASFEDPFTDILVTDEANTGMMPAKNEARAAIGGAEVDHDFTDPRIQTSENIA